MINPKKVAFQGEPGANSHLAIREVYPDSNARGLAEETTEGTTQGTTEETIAESIQESQR